MKMTLQKVRELNIEVFHLIQPDLRELTHVEFSDEIIEQRQSILSRLGSESASTGGVGRGASQLDK